MPNPAFIVDGQMKRRIIEKLCPNLPIKLIGCNGDGVPMDVVAKFIDTQIRLLNNRSYPIIVILDREGRQESTAELLECLGGVLDEMGHRDQYALGMPDRMVENWILADRDVVTRRCGQKFHGDSEGTNGKATLKKMLARIFFYHETTVGVSMFLSCSPRTIV